MKINILLACGLLAQTLIMPQIYQLLTIQTSVTSEGALNTLQSESGSGHKLFAIILSATVIMVIVGLVSTFVTKFALSIRDKKE